MATCKYCKETIKSGARKCPRCGSNDPVGTSIAVIMAMGIGAIFIMAFIIDLATKVINWIADHIWQIIGYPTLMAGLISLYFLYQYHSTNKSKYSKIDIKNGLNNRIALTSVLVISGFFMSFVFGSREEISDNYNTAHGGQIYVTVVDSSNARTNPTTKGSVVVETISPGAVLIGEWVQGSDIPTERWFKTNRNRTAVYVWEGNLTEGR